MSKNKKSNDENSETMSMQLKGLKEHEALAPHTTFGMGGTASYFVEVAEPEVLMEAVKTARADRIPYKIIAGGSNLVIADGHFAGLVIKVSGGKIENRNDERLLSADAGVGLMELVKTAITLGYSGLELLSGIPGTVGGAIVGNAAAYGQAIGERVVEVEVFDPKTNRRFVMAQADCGFAYRDSGFKNDGGHLVILRAVFSFDEGDRVVLEKKSQEIIATRVKKYPPGLKTPGSFFKNLWADKLPAHVLACIPNLKDFYGKVPAWYFLNEVGARGMRLGGLRIADFHGNYIINDGNATYQEVRDLAEELKKRVREKFGVELEEEIRYVEHHE